MKAKYKIEEEVYFFDCGVLPVKGEVIGINYTLLSEPLYTIKVNSEDAEKAEFQGCVAKRGESEILN